MHSKFPRFSSPDNEGKEIFVPKGFYFQPTDKELIEEFLVPKLKGVNTILMNYVKDLDNVCEYDPHQLPYKFEHARKNEAFFFTKNDWRGNSEDVDGKIRATPGGYWKVYRDNVAIYGTNGRVIGFKTKLFFHDNADGSPTNWKMNEIRCHPSLIPTTTAGRKDYVVCKIKLRNLEVENLKETTSESEDEFISKS